MEDILKNENIKKLVLRPNVHVDKETILSLRGTKALRIEDMENTDAEYNREDRTWTDLCNSAKDGIIKTITVTTWSSLVRNVIDELRPQINFTASLVNAEEFIATFNDTVVNICDEIGLTLNMNCPKKLYKESEEPDLIKSSVYMNNKNHMIKILTDDYGLDRYLCAVYTGEIIVMLEALLDTIHFLVEEYRPDIADKYQYHTLVLTYINRADITEAPQEVDTEELDEIDNEISAIDDETTKLMLSKELLFIQQDVSVAIKNLMKIYSKISDVQEKYDLISLDTMMDEYEEYKKSNK